ncbi:MAG: gamma-glutamyl-gamma-aminobutyrate hydrolase family protein [Streptosporangiaceae bacterium]|nr:gamma-glutamyl-gamma-aminobutyrate hydrolase family protein [Streptosporangiaceae bacterium]MBV9857340.1 gamma-glutamyl-gamma-aminobutyrate hydrolase family protein [Streptosporangiaceae bacterium]
MRALFVKQDHASPAGPVGEAFTDLGYDVSEFLVVPEERYHSPGVTVTFPDPARFDAVVAFGAVWAVYDDTIGSWIHDEIAFTRRAIAAGVPVLGICFGGQMLASALGGRVLRASEPEVGWRRIETDRPGLIEPGPWLQWHYDRFELPDGVPAVARTPAADQAFVVGRSLGLQFHPEVTPATMELWLGNGGAAALAADGMDGARLLEESFAVAEAAATRARTLVHRFIRDVAIRPQIMPPMTSQPEPPSGSQPRLPAS